MLSLAPSFGFEPKVTDSSSSLWSCCYSALPIGLYKLFPSFLYCLDLFFKDRGHNFTYFGYFLWLWWHFHKIRNPSVSNHCRILGHRVVSCCNNFLLFYVYVLWCVNMCVCVDIAVNEKPELNSTWFSLCVSQLV